MYQWAHTVYHESKFLGKNFLYSVLIRVNPSVSQQPTIYKLICTLTPKEEFQASENSQAFLEGTWSHESSCTQRSLTGFVCSVKFENVFYSHMSRQRLICTERILACLCKVPFWENDFEHWGHLYGLSPLWMLKCVGKTPVVTNDFVHKNINRVSHQSEILHVSASHATKETFKYTRSSYTVSHHCELCSVS
jgi:hypothetical protein